MKNHGYMCIEFLDYGQGLVDSIHDGLYFDITIHKWVNHDLYFSNGQPYHVIPATCPCNTLKAAIAHLKRHDEIPHGTRFTVVSRYIGQPNAIIVKK